MFQQHIITKASKTLVVGAIDFGTTNSGWACSFLYEFESDCTKASVKQWYSGSGSLTTEKTPTCVLMKPDGKTLHAFGYDAENKYKDLADKNQHKNYFYFRKFKMMLHKKLSEKLDREITLEDEMGRSLPAIDVFAIAIKYLKDDMMDSIKDRMTGNFKDTDVHWVLTVPAIWTDSAKQFMREAAIKAGVMDSQLTIALEPESASIFCRNISVETRLDKADVTVSKFKAGTRYLILDAGGGTIDITVHEVERSGGVKEVHAACGGGWGGTVVDKAFENMLNDLLTRRVYEKFKQEETEDWLDLWRDFELKKRAAIPESDGRINMKFPLALIDMYRKVNSSSLSDDIPGSRFSSDISLSGDKVRFSASLFRSFFDESVRKTIGFVRDVMRDIGVKAILMVGGFSESPILQHAVKSAFPSVHVIIPRDASSAILRGALIYGHSPKSITERILKYTYGICVMRPFRDGIDPESKRIKTEKGDGCAFRFSKHVEKNQIVKVGEVQSEQSYTPLIPYKKYRYFPVYASELKDPQYTDQGCTYVGEMKIEIQDPDDDLNRKVLVSMMFGGTVIELTAVDKKTGEKTKASIDFLG